jgi:hypothetical protein
MFYQDRDILTILARVPAFIMILLYNKGVCH